MAQTIAVRFLPSRWHYHYVRSKLATDPLFGAVAAALAGSRLPLLDLGCGIGLLAHCLDHDGQRMCYLGLDNDAGKIGQARAAALRGGLDQARFEQVDLAQLVADEAGEADHIAQSSASAHHGNVAILDLLQFLPQPAQAPLLRQAAAWVAPGGRLVIRTGLAGRSWRARITRAVDRLSRLLRWMNVGPDTYPERDALASLLDAAGLTATFTPLWGGTPFNNWLVVAERPSAGSGSSGSTQR
jgi:2-polyprenyl-3-methyl-5-hydroxy-6-metoxy-1,4-benzoquinol methylase